ncbi:1-aminocyclopropane-1-carboxylate oxidase 1 [Cajanus cajan]|uniref:aminocyclopropanecarboxylate oxidase n=1 Tax=Cajanus cajan TaxID=3821 RepID=A0A151TKF9_CAJCA|nr:1-aminocyclopropane-1-carboxylate oxidase 1 [Cajanus cajan]KYP67533.1 1-aminocyclopropane-1-carboxylate oxidase [Cajanus cajan]
MEIPVIDFSKLNGDKRGDTMALLHNACEKWGFFMVENHEIDTRLMEKVKQLINTYYEENLKESFYQSEIAKRLEKQQNTSDIDWESAFFIWHRPNSNINQIPNLSQELCQTMDEYIAQLLKLAEKLSELMSENLGLEKGYIKKAFSGSKLKGPAVGTKVAKYPQCPRPELVRGLREHTDAGGIILLLQDDKVPGLEFFKDGKWVEIPPSKNNAIFVNTGDQVEVLSNGLYKSVVHRVMPDNSGSRISIATFYNPIGDAIISPAPKLLYPSNFVYEDYLKLYGSTKFGEKGPRFESMKNMINGHKNVQA